MTRVSLQPQRSSYSGFYDIVAIGTSLGGLKALTAILSDLPADFPVAIVVVQHLSPHFHSRMAEILDRCSPMQIKQAESQERLCGGTVYIAPPDQHFLVTGDRIVTLTHTPRVHFSRPATDPLFESVASCFGSRAIAIVLTGLGADGAKGAEAIKHHGGLVIAQDQATSKAFSMPQTTIHTGIVDWILPLPQIATTLLSLVTTGQALPSILYPHEPS